MNDTAKSDAEIDQIEDLELKARVKRRLAGIAARPASAEELSGLLKGLSGGLRVPLEGLGTQSCDRIRRVMLALALCLEDEDGSSSQLDEIDKVARRILKTNEPYTYERLARLDVEQKKDVGATVLGALSSCDVETRTPERITALIMHLPICDGQTFQDVAELLKVRWVKIKYADGLEQMAVEALVALGLKRKTANNHVNASKSMQVTRRLSRNG